MYTHNLETAIGRLYLLVDRQGVVHRMSFSEVTDLPSDLQVEENKYACGEAEHQLKEYFRGERRRFSLEVKATGTDFQRQVLRRLSKIPYGATVTYGEIARELGRPGAARAVGNAVATNPVPIFIPCHRVIRASGDFGSYALHSMDDERGRKTKLQLLRLEEALK